MKKIVVLTLVTLFCITSYGQYRWEISGGPTFSKLSYGDVETDYGTGFYINAGYGYLTGVRARTSFVFSLDLLQRSSDLNLMSTDFSIDDLELEEATKTEVKVLQIGFNPKFRYLFNTGKDRFRPFINVGPSFRLNTKVEVGGIELEAEEYEQLIIGGVYGAGFSFMIGELFDIFGEFGVMNDFTDNITDQDSKFFDIYARLGVRFRLYDSRR